LGPRPVIMVTEKIGGSIYSLTRRGKDSFYLARSSVCGKDRAW